MFRDASSYDKGRVFDVTCLRESTDSMNKNRVLTNKTKTSSEYTNVLLPRSEYSEDIDSFIKSHMELLNEAIRTSKSIEEVFRKEPLLTNY